MLITFTEAVAPSSSPLSFTLSTHSLTNSNRFPRPRTSLTPASFSVPGKPTSTKSWNLRLVSNRCYSSIFLLFLLIALQFLQLIFYLSFFGLFPIWLLLQDCSLFFFTFFGLFPILACTVILFLCLLRSSCFSVTGEGDPPEELGITSSQ